MTRTLRGRVNRDSHRLHDALTHVHPALERVVGKHLQRLGVLAVRAQAPTPAALQVLGAGGIAAAMALGGSPRLAKTLPAAIIAALGRQSVVIPGTEAFGTVIAGTQVATGRGHGPFRAVAIPLSGRR